MANFRFDAGFRRREVFRFAAVTSLAAWTESFAFAAADFWNKKKPSEWTEQEQQEIRTKSPWAKKVDAEMSGGGGRGAGGGGRGGAGGGFGDGPDAGSGGGGGGGRGGGGRGGDSAVPGMSTQSVSLEVLWQSAQPVLDAHPLKIPDKLNGHYLIAVTGIPLRVVSAAVSGRGGRGGSGGGRFGGGDGRSGGGPDSAIAAPGAGVADGGTATPPADPTAGLKRGATLTAKDKGAENADVVLQTGATLVFAFPKDALALTVADKEVDFELKLGGFSAKAKFTLKEMIYNGELAL